MQDGKSKNSDFEKLIKFLTATLIPLAIAFAGHLFGKQLKEVDIALLESRSNTELIRIGLTTEYNRYQSKTSL